MRDKYGVESDSYCYSGSDVLINLLNIKNPHELAEAETEFTAERYRSYESRQLSPQDFSFEHLQHLHHHIFQDLYEWGTVLSGSFLKSYYLHLAMNYDGHKFPKKHGLTPISLAMLLILNH